MALSTPYPGVTPPYQGNVTETPDGEIDLGASVRNWPEIVPSLGVLWKF